MKSLAVALLLDMVEEPGCSRHQCTQRIGSAACAPMEEADHAPSSASVKHPHYSQQPQQPLQQVEEPQPPRLCCPCSLPVPKPKPNHSTWRSAAAKRAHQPPLSELDPCVVGPYRGLSRQTLDMLKGTGKYSSSASGRRDSACFSGGSCTDLSATVAETCRENVQLLGPLDR